MTGRRTTVLTGHATLAGRDLATNATYREWAAGLALQGLLADGNHGGLMNDTHTSRAAVQYADALIAALAVEREQA